MILTISIVLILVLLAMVALALGVHLGFRAPRILETSTPADHGLDFETVRIPTVRQRHLFGWLLPAPGARCTVVLVHGWGGNAEMMLPLAKPLLQAGYRVLFYDARNHGQSDTDSFSSLPRFAEDLGAVIRWLKQQPGLNRERIAVLGHSVGAGATLFEATRNPDIDTVISIAAFADPAEMTAQALQRLPAASWFTPLVIRYVQWVIGHSFAEIAPIQTIRRTRCPVLLVHGQADTVVPVGDARRIAAAASPDRVRLVEIAGAGHDSVEHIEQHADVLLHFLRETGLSGPAQV